MKSGQPALQTPVGFNIANLPARPKPVEGDYGQPMRFLTNYYRIKFREKEQQTFYQLEMSFQPPVEQSARKKIKEIIRAMKAGMEQKLGPFVERGTMMWVFKDPKQNISFKAQVTEERGKDVEYTLFLKKTKQICLSLNEGAKESQQVIQVLNSIWKKKMIEVGMVEIGRNSKFYRTDNGIPVRNTDLMVWRGFTTSIQIINRAAYLMVDFSTRILRSESLNKIMMRMNRQQKKDLIGQTIIAPYGNYRTYKIEGFEDNKGVMTTFIKNGKEVTFKQYYKEAYGVTVKDMHQPLIRSTAKKFVMGENGRLDEVIDEVLLLPELVRLTGMTDEQHNDRNLMKELAFITKLTPAARIEENQRLFDNQTLIKNEVFKIEREEVSMPGEVLHSPVLLLKDREEYPNNGQVNIRAKILCPSVIKDWIVVFSDTRSTDRQQFQDFLHTLVEAGKTFGIEISEPGYYYTDGSLDSFCEKIQSDVKKNGKPQIVLTFLNNYEAKYYTELKQLLYLKLGVPHQNVLRKSLNKNPMSVASNIILQMNAKLGDPLWQVNRSLKVVRNRKIAIGGLAVYHKLINKGHSCQAFVGTIDNDLTKYYSYSKLIPTNTQRVESLQAIMLKWIQTYFKRNSTLPDTMIIYRDGVGEGQFAGVATVELPALQKAVKKAVERIGAAEEPEIIFVVANKKVSQRMFEDREPYDKERGGKGQSKIANPPPGSVIAGPMSRYNYDFFLVPQWVNQGTATPTHFVVVHNSSDLSCEALKTLTNQQCYNYYNWKGAIRIPASLMYANKLATMVGQYLKETPTDPNLIDKLYSL